MSTGENEIQAPVETPTPAPEPKKPKAPVEKATPVKAEKAKAPAKKKVKVKVKAPAKKKVKTPAKKKVKVKVKAPAARRTKGPANVRKALHDLLLKKLPEKYRADKTSLDFDKIASGQKMTIEGVYKWFRNDRVTPAGVLTFVKMGAGKLKLADFHPFVFKK